MSDRSTLQDITEARRHFQLPHEALIEKDWFVVRALAAIHAAEKEPFQFVFQGGTAPSRAHRIIDRMSEDIDIKIVLEGKPPRSASRRLRESITSELLRAGFEFDPKNEALEQITICQCAVLRETVFQPNEMYASRNNLTRAAATP